MSNSYYMFDNVNTDKELSGLEWKWEQVAKLIFKILVILTCRTICLQTRYNIAIRSS